MDYCLHKAAPSDGRVRCPCSAVSTVGQSLGEDVVPQELGKDAPELVR
jgi:hypothetical protein